MKPRSMLLGFAVGIVALNGCGGGGGSSTSISVTPANPSITVAADQQFTATLTNADGSTTDITSSATWSSSDAAVSTIVSTSGLATAVAAGTSTITATNGSVSGTTVMTVTAQELVDVHAHATLGPSASAQDLVDMMTNNGISTMILTATPALLYQDPDTSSQAVLDFFNSYSSLFRVMYGGSELEPLLLASGHNDPLPFTESTLYPNGGSPGQMYIDGLNAIAADPTTYEPIFQNRATQAAQSGLFVAFGELAALHYSTKSGQPYINYKVDTPWMLWLTGPAAQYHMPIDLHVEATETTVAELSTLLSYNTNAKIIWDHAGWTNLSTTIATAELFSQMMADHPNLYLSVKMRSGEEGGTSSPVESDGTIKSSWYTLLTTYADRIMVGTDAKYWSGSSGGTVEQTFDEAYSALNAMLEQLPSETAVKIRDGTARTLFGL